MATVIDALFFELGITGNFSQEAEKAIATTDVMGKKYDTVTQKAKNANVAINNLAKNLGISANVLKDFLHSAKMNGGSEAGAINFFKKLSEEAEKFVKTGKSHFKETFKELDIDFVDKDNLEQARNVLAIVNDLSRAFGNMNRVEAFNLSKEMGMDEGLFNTIADGPKKLRKNLNESRKELKKFTKAEKVAQKQTEGFLKTLNKTVKVIKALPVAIATKAISSLVSDTAQANVQLDNLANNIGASRSTLSDWGGAAELAGGSAQGMLGSLKSLSSGLNRFVLTGDASALQFFQQLGVMPLEASGKIKDFSELMLELADKFSSMDQGKALIFAQGMGIDEDTFNLLRKGRTEVEKMLAQEQRLYRSKKEDIETSQKLVKATNLANQQFEALKLMIANAVAPVLLKVSEIVSKFFDFLMQHEAFVQGFFIGLAGVITTILIPTLWSAAAAALAFMAPFLPGILLVLGLAAAIGLLYDDYKKWADGFDSLFDWSVFIKWFSDADFSVKNLAKGFARLITGYESWEKAVDGAKSWLKMKGIIDENGVSLEGIKNYFIELAQTLLNEVIPILNRVGDIASAMWNGDWDKVGNLLSQSGTDTLEWLNTNTKILWDNITGRFVEAVDVAAGYDPDKDPNSLTQASKNGKIYNTEGATGKPRVDESGNVIGMSSKKFNGFGEDVDGYIKEASERYGIPEDVLRGFVKMENGWTGKMSPTGAIGTGQFIRSTWNNLAETQEGNAIGMTKITNDNFRTSNDPRYNKKVNTLATGLLAKQNAELLRKVGLPVTGENLYMLHNIGPGVIPALKGSNDVSEKTLLAMKQNGMKEGMSPSDFVKYQQKQYGKHYFMANDVTPKKAIDLNKPLVGTAKASAIQANEIARMAMMSHAQSTNISNNQKTEIVIRDGIHIQSSASTISGTAGDAITGIQQRVNVMHYNNGLG